MEKLPPSPWMPPEALPEYVAACKVCTHKISQHPPPGLLHPLPVPHRPWSNIRWTSSQGCPHLKVTPPFSQWLTDFPRGCIPLLCPSSPLLSARGQSQFLLQLPSPSQTGRLNQELETRLHCLLVQNPTSWCKHLIWVEYAHNTLPCSASGLSPFECAYGSHHPLFPEVESRCPQLKLSSVEAVGSGVGLVSFSYGASLDRRKRMADGRLLSINLGK